MVEGRFVIAQWVTTVCTDYFLSNKRTKDHLRIVNTLKRSIQTSSSRLGKNTNQRYYMLRILSGSSQLDQEICTGAGPANVSPVKALTSAALFCDVKAANAIPANPSGIVVSTFPSPAGFAGV